MTRRYRQRAGTWGTAANGCGACGTFSAPAADRSLRRGHLNAERSDGAARHGTAGQGGGGPPGGRGGPGRAIAPPLPPPLMLLPPRSRPPVEEGKAGETRRLRPARGAQRLSPPGADFLDRSARKK
ncbi:methyl-CpG-binding domain protein 2-like [Falco peregrinus]|uniref:methyl-CpG-binding domain protein 2-like n=1 Tax=Falco peregrinus TaxID=8954 RepID=UPI002479C58E|nr:methyl-CpG-binding domain protein 2-like [Falco peregrinus]